MPFASIPDSDPGNQGRGGNSADGGAGVEDTVAKALSLCGNHSVTVLTAAGKLADSPRPRKNRASENRHTVPANACAAPARLHTATASDINKAAAKPVEQLACKNNTCSIRHLECHNE